MCENPVRRKFSRHIDIRKYYVRDGFLKLVPLHTHKMVADALTKRGKTGVTADRDKIEFRLFNSSSIFNITLHEELFSLPKQNQIMNSCPGFMVLVTWVKFLG